MRSSRPPSCSAAFRAERAAPPGRCHAPSGASGGGCRRLVDSQPARGTQCAARRSCRRSGPHCRSAHVWSADSQSFPRTASHSPRACRLQRVLPCGPPPASSTGRRLLARPTGLLPAALVDPRPAVRLRTPRRSTRPTGLEVTQRTGLPGAFPARRGLRGRRARGPTTPPRAGCRHPVHRGLPGRSARSELPRAGVAAWPTRGACCLGVRRPVRPSYTDHRLPSRSSALER